MRTSNASRAGRCTSRGQASRARHLAHPFLHWFLLRWARQRASIRRHPASADRDLRRRVSVALDFLKWTTSRRLTRELTVPSIPRQEPQDLLDEDDRWPLLQRCLTDEAAHGRLGGRRDHPCCSARPRNASAI